ncbi:uncharacterized protein JCM6883_007547 [Sporobolomyces salmoneus]|uniref:uncharacterized protein n=1 Tax=Sporobolomyces salmoneus TaxID=183962 RepID=UPI003175F241
MASNGRRPNASPLHNETGSSTSYTSASSPGHLRNRSQGASNQSHDPFDDRNAASGRSSPPLVPMPPLAPTPHRAALMAVSQSTSSLAEANATEQAMNVRGPRAEWTPTQQFLYSPAASSHGHGAMAPPTIGYSGLRGSPASSIFDSPLHGSPASSSQNHSSRFDISPQPDDFLFTATTYPEADDALHDPGEKMMTYGPDRRLVEPREYRKRTGGIFGISWIGLLNLTAVGILMAVIILLFAGYPIYNWLSTPTISTYGATGLGGTNGTSQIPEMPTYRGLIDPDTPEEALTRTGFDGKEYQLVFSDEFNTDGRKFYAGMDPYWEAVDLHYWQTNDVEWYDPENVYTEDGALVIELTKEPNSTSHGLGYLSSMVQSWNKFCFVGGNIEVAASLPGDVKVSGLWPAAWTMSNLGRAGYGGSLDGNWPYVYDTCDVGTLANQTNPETGLPKFTAAEGDQYHDDALSFLSGQRYSACTCKTEEDHPGPKNSDGTWKGRGASEIDIFEATVNPYEEIGEISQSAQWAPFNPSYSYLNSSTDYVEWFPDAVEKWDTHANVYQGGATQQVTSGLSQTDPDTYNSTTNFQSYGFEYQPSEFEGFGTGYITWSQNGSAMWTIRDSAMAANSRAEVGNRVVTAEPMYAIFNLGMSPNFGVIDYNHLTFPAKMRIDWIRVWQQKDKINIGCDPESNPTVQYIVDNPELYHNNNLTTLADAGRTFPKNRLIDKC